MKHTFKKVFSKIVSGVLAAASAVTMVAGMSSVSADAATTTLTNAQITAKLTTLSQKYPSGSYWKTPNTVLYGGKQCYAFARQLAVEVFGTYPTTNIAYTQEGTMNNGWKAVRNPANVTLEPGDIIRAKYDTHTAMIWKVENGRVYVGECWGSQNNKVNWGSFNGDYSVSTVQNLLKSGYFTGVWKHPGSGQPPVPPTGFKTMKNYQSGKMLNVVGNGSASGTNVTVYQQDGTTGQNFRLIAHGGTKYFGGNPYQKYVIEAQCAPSCGLNVYGSTSVSGNNVNLWTKSGNDTQDWILQPSPYGGAGYYIIRSANNTSCVLTEAGTGNGSNVMISTYQSGNKNQIWYLGTL